MINQCETITYHFFHDSPDHYTYKLEISSADWRIIGPKPIKQEAWTRLDFHQCKHCPLEDKVNYCPLASQLSTLTHVLSKTQPGIDSVIRVESGARICEKHTSVEQGMKSLLGLVFASCDCPHLQFFKPMARFHLPFATEEENLFRVFATFALFNVLTDKPGLEFEMVDLRKIYQNLQIINAAMCDRIKEISESDSALDAVLLLNVLSKSMLYSIDETFREFSKYFKIDQSTLLQHT